MPDASRVEVGAGGEPLRFRCSATNLGPWRGNPPTGRRFERVDEVYVYRVEGGQITEAWGIEDTPSRERQLGLPPSAERASNPGERGHRRAADASRSCNALDTCIRT